MKFGLLTSRCRASPKKDEYVRGGCGGFLARPSGPFPNASPNSVAPRNLVPRRRSAQPSAYEIDPIQWFVPIHETPQVRQVVTESDIPASGELKVPLGTIVTPSARDLAITRGVLISQLPAEQISSAAPPEKTVALGADHGGFQMKELIKPVFAEFGLTVRDIGVYDEKPVDYPDIALQVAELVAAGGARRGVIVDGAGIGSAMAANKVPGVRAALCYDKSSAKNSREHNDSNVLTLGGKLFTRTQAEDVLRVWLSTPFGGGRHQARIDKIIQIERKYAK